MWLTGFDVPSLSILYLDKPLKGHNLFQAMARVNRVYPNKQRGLVVDYIGVKNEIDKVREKYTAGSFEDRPIVDTAAMAERCVEKYKKIRDALKVKTTLLEFIKSYDNDIDGLNVLRDRAIKIIESAEASGGQDEFLPLTRSFLLDYRFLVYSYYSVQKLQKEAEIIQDIVAIFNKKNNAFLRSKVFVSFDDIIEADKPISLSVGEKDIFSEEFAEDMEGLGANALLVYSLGSVAAKKIEDVKTLNPYLEEKFLDKLSGIIDKYKDRFNRNDEAGASGERGEVNMSYIARRIKELSAEVDEGYSALVSSGMSPLANAVLSILQDGSEEISATENLRKEDIARKIEDIISPELTFSWEGQEQLRARVKVKIQNYLSEVGLSYDEGVKVSNDIDERVARSYENFALS